MSHRISSLNQPIPLSHAKSNRRENDASDKIELSETRLKALLSEVVDEKIVSKITRLENSVNKMMAQFEGVINGNSEDAALRVTTNSDASDIASANISIPKEELYPYTCGMLAEKLDLRRHDILNIIKQLDLRNDIKYHYSLKTGKTSQVQKWSEETYQRIKEALDSKEYLRPNLD